MAHNIRILADARRLLPPAESLRFLALGADTLSEAIVQPVANREKRLNKVARRRMDRRMIGDFVERIRQEVIDEHR